MSSLHGEFDKVASRGVGYTFRIEPALRAAPHVFAICRTGEDVSAALKWYNGAQWVRSLHIARFGGVATPPTSATNPPSPLEPPGLVPDNSTSRDSSTSHNFTFMQFN